MIRRRLQSLGTPKGQKDACAPQIAFTHGTADGLFRA